MTMTMILDHDAPVVSHTHRRIGQPTWAVLSPTAVATIAEAVYVTDATLQLTFNTPDGVFGDAGKPGRLSAHRSRGGVIRHVSSSGYHVDDIAVVCTNPAPGCKTTSMWINPSDAAIADTLRFTEKAMVAGHNVLLWTDGIVLTALDLGPA